MTTGNETADRAGTGAATARQPTVASPAGLAVRLGRELSPFEVDDDGWTDLHYAAALSARESARSLLLPGPAVDARLAPDGRPLGAQLLETLSACGLGWLGGWRRTGCTPLHVAVAAGAEPVVRVLLDGGADPGTPRTRGRPRRCTTAARGAGLPVAAALLSAGANAGARAAGGITPLHTAARWNAAGAAAVLLAAGADAHAPAAEGETPQHRAAAGDAAEPAAVLLAAVADVQARSADGATPLHVAALKDATAAAVLLLGGADLDAQAGDGAMPLHVAAIGNAGGMAALLLDRGADPHAPDVAGQTPLHWAGVGTGVPVRPSEVDGRRGKQPDGSARTREVKLVTVWTAQTRDKDGKPVRDPGSVSYNAAVESAASRDTDPLPSAFAQRVYREAQRRGFDTAVRRVVLGDGAAWIWRLSAEQFPGAIEIVDIYHAKQHLCDVAKAILRRRDRAGRRVGQGPVCRVGRRPAPCARRRAAHPCRDHARGAKVHPLCVRQPPPDALSAVPRQRTMRRLGRRRGRMQADRRTAQARRNALDRARRQRHHRPAMLPAQRALRRFLGATSRKSRLRGTSQICRAPMGSRTVGGFLGSSH